MFETLAVEGINIQMISTSEIKISVVVDEKYLELGVRALHEALDWPGNLRGEFTVIVLLRLLNRHSFMLAEGFWLVD